MSVQQETNQRMPIDSWRTKNKKTRMPGWLAPLTSTVIRCHLLGSVTAVSLIICIAWIWSLSRAEVSTIQVSGRTVDLNQAAALVENAAEWRQLYTVNFHKSKEVEERVHSVAAWLPTEIDWPSTEKEIRSASELHELTVLSIDQGSTHVGARIGVVGATCEVSGTFASLCRFLNEMSNRPRPIACSEIKLLRIGTKNDAASQPRSQTCRATLWLRIPFAANATPAGQILIPERPMKQTAQTSVQDHNQTPRLLTPGTNHAS